MARSVARMNRFEDRMHNYHILVPFQLMAPEYANLSFLLGQCNSLVQWRSDSSSPTSNSKARNIRSCQNLFFTFISNHPSSVEAAWNGSINNETLLFLSSIMISFVFLERFLASMKTSSSFLRRFCSKNKNRMVQSTRIILPFGKTKRWIMPCLVLYVVISFNCSVLR